MLKEAVSFRLWPPVAIGAPLLAGWPVTLVGGPGRPRRVAGSAGAPYDDYTQRVRRWL